MRGSPPSPARTCQRRNVMESSLPFNEHGLGSHPLNSGLLLLLAAFVSISYASIVAVNAVERHEIAIDTTAAVVNSPLRR